MSRLQTLNERSRLYLSIRGQSSSRNLEVSEKFSLGGANGVRAYPQGEAYGDIGYIFTAELRRKFGEGLNLPGEFQAIGFFDTGTDFLYKSPIASSDNRRTLTGLGVGLDWTDGEDLTVRASYAHKVGAGATTAGTNTLGGQFWIQGSQNF